MSTLIPAEFVTATFEYAAVAPMLIVFGAALVGVLVAAFAPRRDRHTIQVALALGSLVIALAVLVLVSIDHQGATIGVPDSNAQLVAPVVIDGPGLFLQGTVLVLSIVGLILMAERLGGVGSDAFTPMGAATPGSTHEGAAQRAGMLTSEAFPLAMFAVGGMMLFTVAADLLTMFVALEVLSLPLYILTGLARRRRLLSQEAALKYFLLGAFSSAFFLFGAALLYGYAGSVYLREIAAAINGAGDPQLEPVVLPAIVLLLVGLLFKVGAVPFHSWTPDVYQGAPTPVTGFMAACTKVAAFGAILRLLYVGLEGSRWDYEPMLAIVAVLTMVVGAVLTVTQTDVKRLLAYSSIAHAGFILVGLIAFNSEGIGAVLFYLLAYGFTTIAAFGIIYFVRSGGAEATHLSQWAGLGRRHPIVAATFAFLMLAFAGIPLTSGFAAKFAAFSAALSTQTSLGGILVLVGVLASAVTVFAYVRLIVLMYFTEAGDSSVAYVRPSMLSTGAIAVGTLVTLVLGLAPASMLRLAENASLFIR